MFFILYNHNITMSLLNIKKSNDTLDFVLANVNLSVANSIRRTILSECESVAFSTEDYLNSDIKITKNTSSLHNEFLLHRLGLIPIYIKDKKNFVREKYKFILKKKNNGGTVMNVTTGDFEIIDTETNETMKNEDFFKVDSITKEHILILKLVPNQSSEGQEIDCEGFASISNGKKNARYIPVSCAVYKNTIDENSLKKALENVEKKNQKAFKIEESERYFKKDENEEPNEFDFTIESVGIYEPEDILKEALDILIMKLMTFRDNLGIIVENNTSLEHMRVYESFETMKSFTIEIDNETHTLGTLIQSHLVDHEDVMFIGYKNPHPLQDKIMFKIKVHNDDLGLVNTVIGNKCNDLIDMFKSFKETINKKFKK